MPNQNSEQCILIADGDQTVRALQKFFLEKAGFSVTFVDDGQAALERALTQPALIVTEIMIPKIDGLTLCRRLRADPVTRAIPIVVFSILAAATRAKEAGAAAFLRKPLVESIFVTTIQELIVGQPAAAEEHQWVSH
jgi:CheY-like chemotaxis protein